MDTKTAGRRGGRARAARMTPDQRRDAAEKARRARWDRIDSLSEEIAAVTGAQAWAGTLAFAVAQAEMTASERNIVVQRVLSYVAGLVG